MSDLRTILERGVGGATPPPDGFDRMLSAVQGRWWGHLWRFVLRHGRAGPDPFDHGDGRVFFEGTRDHPAAAVPIFGFTHASGTWKGTMVSRPRPSISRRVRSARGGP
jgi:hypothetical protein